MKRMIGSAASGVLLTAGLLLVTSCDRSFEARLGRPRPFAPDGSRGIESGKVFAVSGTANTDFKVIFFGLIVVANTDTSGNPAKPRRAVLVEGDSPDMLHEPLLIVDKPADKAAQTALKDALDTVTGRVTDCDNSKYRDSCVVNVAGVAMRIRDTAGNVAINTLSNHASFTIVPSLKTRATWATAKKELKTGLLTQKLPATPVAAYFEIDGGGTLKACPFARGGVFGGGSTAACEQFASDVYWFGMTTTPAVLQLASKLKSEADGGDLEWKTIPIANTGRLEIAISNEPLIPPTGASTEHFDLFEKVLDGGQLPPITADCAPPKCPGACVKCTKQQVIVPGCSDSQWP